MEESIVCLFNFYDKKIQYSKPATEFDRKILDSKDNKWMYNSNQEPNTSKIKDNRIVDLMPLSVVVYTLKNSPAFFYLETVPRAAGEL
jgi:hypothetical protein